MPRASWASTASSCAARTCCRNRRCRTRARSGRTTTAAQFEKNLDMALKLADVAGFEARKAESKKRGRLRGLGIVNAIEQAAGTAQPEYAEIRFNPSGTAALLMGTKDQGQGHETMFKQILNERLGHRPGRRAVHRRRHRPRRLRHGHQRLALDGAGRLGAVPGRRQGDRQGQASLPATCSRPASRTSSSPTASSRSKGTDRSVTLKQVAMAAFNPAKWPKGFEGGLYENATYLGAEGHLPQRLPCLRGRGRSRDRRRHARPLLRGRRCRHGDEPDRAEGPDPRRRRPGHRPDPVRAGRVGPRDRASC